jgi:pimeloyl-ACP methyl ester carboxylesterase
MKKVFIVHGWTYTTTAWDECVKALNRRDTEAVILHVPGLTEPSDEIWDLEKYVSWLESKLPVGEKVNLVGHSNGGRIAIAFNARFPHRVNKLILIDAAGLPRNELIQKEKRAFFKILSIIGKPFAKISIIRKIFHKIAGASDYERAPTNMRETMKRLLAVDITPELLKISTPTLILWGDRDIATPPKDGDRMRDLIEDSKLFVIARAGHSPHQSHPETVSREIHDFISK